jgi:hypothetical protein
MPVTFGTVQLLPAPPAAAPAADAGPAAPSASAPPPALDPRDLAALQRFLHSRAARVRAH